MVLPNHAYAVSHQVEVQTRWLWESMLLKNRIRPYGLPSTPPTLHLIVVLQKTGFGI